MQSVTERQTDRQTDGRTENCHVPLATMFFNRPEPFSNLKKFHENWAKNVTSRVLSCFHYIHIEKNAPPTGGHVFSPIWTIFKLVREINKTNVLTNFHDDWAKIVTSRVFTRKNAQPTGVHVFQLTETTFELNQHIIKTNILTNFELDRDFIGTKLLTKFHKDRKINVASRFKAEDMNAVSIVVCQVVSSLADASGIKSKRKYSGAVGYLRWLQALNGADRAAEFLFLYTEVVQGSLGVTKSQWLSEIQYPHGGAGGFVEGIGSLRKIISFIVLNEIVECV
ncbi:hypothetical protein DPMN_042153 [Dreissena polymorpha]|uniref:Uncharacterized protein n=1 Tax=Dreissena polymorpha TaxID=45954 RepID=A0A9D4D1I4_DREPO|nr:hypothetical protein DPMN_042153 [Dreissena polymorpha]